MKKTSNYELGLYLSIIAPVSLFFIIIGILIGLSENYGYEFLVGSITGIIFIHACFYIATQSSDEKD